MPAAELKVTYADLEKLYEIWYAPPIAKTDDWTERQKIVHAAEYAYDQLQKINAEKNAPTAVADLTQLDQSMIPREAVE